MKHGLVHPEIPRYQWSELPNPSRVILDHVDEHYVEHFRNRLKQTTEPPLDGVPGSPKESVFFMEPSLTDACDLVAHALPLQSSERRKFMDRTVTLMKDRPVFAERLLASLHLLTNTDITAGINVRVTARLLKEKIEERRYQLGHDIINPSADTKLVDRVSVDDIVDRFIDYRNIKPEKKRQRVNQQARELIVDPQDIDYVFETFNLLEASDIFSATGLQTMREYAADLAKAVDMQIDLGELPQPSDIGMEYWVAAWAHGGNERADKLIRTMIERADSPAKITDVIYQLLLAAAGSGNSEVMEATLRLIASSRDEMPSDSNQAADLKAALFNEELEIYDRAWEIQEAENVMTTLLVDLEQPDSRGVEKMYSLIQARLRQTEVINSSERYKQDVIRVGVEHNEHYKKAVERLSGSKQGKTMKDEGFARRLLIWKARTKAVKDVMSGNMARHLRTSASTGPLGEWTLDNSAYVGVMTALRRNKNKVYAHLNLPGIPASIAETSRLAASQTVQAILGRHNFDSPITQRTYWNTLGYLTPKGLSLDDFPRFTNANEAVREDLMHDKVHSLSPRGDTVEITNDVLVDLGFDSLTFTMHPERKDLTLVTLRVGNAAFQCYLDRSYTLREMDTKRGIGIEASAPFLENIILSHLHQIHCTENDEIADEVDETAPTQRIEYRRAHRRVLPLGQNPSGDQIIIAWDEYGIDLVKQNRHRLDAGEAQLITWVSQVKPEHVAGRQPVRSKGNIAGARLADLLVS